MTNSRTEFPLAASVAFSLDTLESTSSTNTVVREALPPLSAFSVVLTTNQFEGKGRLGRRWFGSPGEMLAASVVVPAQNSNSLSLTPLIVGACLQRSLCEHGIQHARLKWPNDVVVEGRKIAGILCEVRADGAVIAGVGLNLEFKGEPPSPLAISLAECGVNPSTGADSILARLLSLLREWEAKPTNDQLAFVRSTMSTVGLFVEVSLADGSSWRGIAVDITPQGHLLVSAGSQSSPIAVVAADIEHLYQ